MIWWWRKFCFIIAPKNIYKHLIANFHSSSSVNGPKLIYISLIWLLNINNWKIYHQSLLFRPKIHLSQITLTYGIQKLTLNYVFWLHIFQFSTGFLLIYFSDFVQLFFKLGHYRSQKFSYVSWNRGQKLELRILNSFIGIRRLLN